MKQNKWMTMQNNLHNDTRPFRNLMISVVILIATFFYAFFRFQAHGSLNHTDNIIILIMAIAGFSLVLLSGNNDRMKLDKI